MASGCRVWDFTSLEMSWCVEVLWFEPAFVSKVWRCLQASLLCLNIYGA